MSTVSQIFTILLTYGPKLPAVAAIIQESVEFETEQVQRLSDLLGTPMPEAVYAASAEDNELEAKVLALYAEHATYAGPEADRGVLQNLLTLIKENPWIAQLVLSFLKRG